MLIEKLEKAVYFTSQEKIIAEFILQNPDEFQQLNCEALGKATFTSKSTVVRLCKKLGVLGYQELKKILYFEFSEERKVNHSQSIIINGSSTYKDIIKILPEIYKKSTDEVDLYNNPNVFNRIINRMYRMDYIDLYGTGFSYTLMESVAQKLNLMGIECKAYNTLNERYMLANRKKGKIMAFVMTFSGNNPLAIHEAEVLKSLGVYVVGIAGCHADEIIKSCDEVLHIPPNSLGFEMQGILANHCIMYMMDIFVAAMLAKNYDHIVDQEHMLNFDYDKEFYYDTKVSKKNARKKS